LKEGSTELKPEACGLYTVLARLPHKLRDEVLTRCINLKQLKMIA